MLAALSAIAVARGEAGAQVTVEGLLLTDSPGGVPPIVYLLPQEGVVRVADRQEVSIDQAGLRYLPAVTVVPPGSRVTFRNSDPLLHNVFGPGEVGFDLGTFPRDETRSHVFDELGTHIILCHVHPEMYAYVVVLPTPYFAFVDERGRFVMEGVPEGAYEVRVWHRRDLQHRSQLRVGAGDDSGVLIDLRGER